MLGWALLTYIQYGAYHHSPVCTVTTVLVLSGNHMSANTLGVNQVNVAIHVICVPPILLTAFALVCS